MKRIVRGEPITSLPAARQPEPIVNVTIGRIEVRAVPAPAPSTRERVKPPVMSLEQYLRRRDGRSGA